MSKMENEFRRPAISEEEMERLNSAMKIVASKALKSWNEEDMGIFNEWFEKSSKGFQKALHYLQSPHTISYGKGMIAESPALDPSRARDPVQQWWWDFVNLHRLYKLLTKTGRELGDLPTDELEMFSFFYNVKITDSLIKRISRRLDEKSFWMFDPDRGSTTDSFSTYRYRLIVAYAIDMYGRRRKEVPFSDLFTSVDDEGELNDRVTRYLEEKGQSQEALDYEKDENETQLISKIFADLERKNEKKGKIFVSAFILSKYVQDSPADIARKLGISEESAKVDSFRGGQHIFRSVTVQAITEKDDWLLTSNLNLGKENVFGVRSLVEKGLQEWVKQVKTWEYSSPDSRRTSTDNLGVMMLARWYKDHKLISKFNELNILNVCSLAKNVLEYWLAHETTHAELAANFTDQICFREVDEVGSYLAAAAGSLAVFMFPMNKKTGFSV